MIKLTKLSEKLEREFPDEVRLIRDFYFEEIKKNESKKL